MKVFWSKVDDPYEWRPEGGGLWVGHTVLAVWIVKGLEQLERLRQWLRALRHEASPTTRNKE